MIQQLASRVFDDEEMNKRTDYMITFHSVLDLDYWSEEIQETVLMPDNLKYAHIMKVINKDWTNAHIWKRLLASSYKRKVGIYDLFSFCEVALTQLEFMCLMCKAAGKISRPTILDIHLVHIKSYHCLRDYNFCKSCILKSASKNFKTCPFCLSSNKALILNNALEDVFDAMNIPQSLPK
ncbi:hypothetical protein BDA99DRAFT_542764 [Phascolomyces articulosus]|uniref:Uncharacterized protein n=1 Tax=Phascolomyces articulosus TaxID=60185 RepID=A0AAD5JP17_9FUNG|nr:hypothetical protein BDA99DRAFT_542764 [Phascolomyces articulosus]